MRVKMIPQMSETVATSRDSVVLPVAIGQISNQYVEHFENIKDDVLRFNLPTEYTVKLGTRYDIDGLYLYTKDDVMLISSLDLGLGQGTDNIRLGTFLAKSKGNPTSCILSIHEDDQWLAVPKHFSPFQEGEEINYEYIEQYEEDGEWVERHLRITRK